MPLDNSEGIAGGGSNRNSKSMAGPQQLLHPTYQPIIAAVNRWRWAAPADVSRLLRSPFGCQRMEIAKLSMALRSVLRWLLLLLIFSASHCCWLLLLLLLLASVMPVCGCWCWWCGQMPALFAVTSKRAMNAIHACIISFVLCNLCTHLHICALCADVCLLLQLVCSCVFNANLCMQMHGGQHICFTYHATAAVVLLLFFVVGIAAVGIAFSAHLCFTAFLFYSFCTA